MNKKEYAETVKKNSPNSRFALNCVKAFLIGGIPELIVDNGYLFESGNSNDLRAKIADFEKLSQQEYDAMKSASLELYKSTYTSEAYYKKLSKVYDKLIEKNTVG